MGELIGFREKRTNTRVGRRIKGDGIVIIGDIEVGVLMANNVLQMLLRMISRLRILRKVNENKI